MTQCICQFAIINDRFIMQWGTFHFNIPQKGILCRVIYGFDINVSFPHKNIHRINVVRISCTLGINLHTGRFRFSRKGKPAIVYLYRIRLIHTIFAYQSSQIHLAVRCFQAFDITFDSEFLYKLLGVCRKASQQYNIY